MRLRFGHLVGLRNAKPPESYIIAAVGIAVNMLYAPGKTLDFSVYLLCGFDSLAYNKRNNLASPPRISSPYGDSVDVFFILVYISSSSITSGSFSSRR